MKRTFRNILLLIILSMIIGTTSVEGGTTNPEGDSCSAFVSAEIEPDVQYIPIGSIGTYILTLNSSNTGSDSFNWGTTSDKIIARINGVDPFMQYGLHSFVSTPYVEQTFNLDVQPQEGAMINSEYWVYTDNYETSCTISVGGLSTSVSASVGAGAKIVPIPAETPPTSTGITITSPLKIIGPYSEYATGDIIKAQFSITNQGDAPVTLKVLTVGGRDSNGKVVDFSWIQNININPGQNYFYVGSLALRDVTCNSMLICSYHFFIAYQTADDNWNTNVDLAPGLVEKDRTQDIDVSRSVLTSPQKYSSDRNGMIAIPIEEFSEGKGKDIPIFVPSVVDNSNVIREDNDWITVKNIPISRYNFDFWKFISGYTQEPEDPTLPGSGPDAAVSAGVMFLQSLGTSSSVLTLDIIIQQNKKTPENFRSIIQYGNTEIAPYMKGVHVIMDNPTQYKKYISEAIANKFQLDPTKEYSMILRFDTAHEKDLNIGYLSLSPDNKIILTPKTYSGDVLQIDRCEMHIGYMCVSSKVILDLSGDSFIGLMQSRINDAGSNEIFEALKPISLNPKSGYIAQIHSPGELRIYDSQNRVTGLVDGNVKQEIQNSLYYSENKRIAIFDSTDTYRYEVKGTGIGSYGLDVSYIEDNKPTTFSATDIPTTPGQIHQYTVDWNVLSNGGSGITLNVDYNGDGTFEDTIISGSTLSRQGGTSISVAPRSVNVIKDQYNVTNIKVKNTQNIPDTFRIYINVSEIPAQYRADLSWFNWTEKNVYIGPGKEAVIPIKVSPSITGTKMFRAKINSTTSSKVYAFDTGTLKIT